MFLKAVDPSQVPRRQFAGELAAAAAPPVAAPRRLRGAAPRCPSRRPRRVAAGARRPPRSPPPRVDVAPPPTTRATTPPRPSSRSGWPSRPRRPGLPPSCRSWPRWSNPASRTSTSATPTRVGSFQMRVGIWDQGAYKGFAEKPELQAKWFIDTALAVKRKAIARGDADLARTRRSGARDRRHRAPRRAIPRPLPAAAGRSAQAPHVALERRFPAGDLLQPPAVFRT